jgi:hypothetical protein
MVDATFDRDPAGGSSLHGAANPQHGQAGGRRRKRDYAGDAFAVLTILATAALPLAVAFRLGL